jgi:ribosomal protein L25 (general stress protein Ctc)
MPAFATLSLFPAICRLENEEDTPFNTTIVYSSKPLSESMESITMSQSKEQSNNSPFSLQATERDNTLNPRQLRNAGFLPATLYGKEIEPQSIQVRDIDFTRAYGKGARDFQLEGLEAGPVVARAHEVQSETVSGKVLSIQFLHVSGAVKSSAPKPPAPKKQKESEKASDSSVKAETVLTGA